MNNARIIKQKLFARHRRHSKCKRETKIQDIQTFKCDWQSNVTNDYSFFLTSKKPIDRKTHEISGKEESSRAKIRKIVPLFRAATRFIIIDERCFSSKSSHEHEHSCDCMKIASTLAACDILYVLWDLLRFERMSLPSTLLLLLLLLRLVLLLTVVITTHLFVYCCDQYCFFFLSLYFIHFCF